MFAQRPDSLRLGGEAQNIFHIIFTYMNPFIHLLGFSLIQWMIVRIKGIEELKQDSQVCLGGEVRLGGALLCLGGPESAKFLGSGSPRRSDLCLGGALRLGVHSYA